MRPIELRIKGLNSFIKEQTVDFEKLTSRGMFGIFGPTGSGKSTILDGITLALYGEIARKSSNFINTNCNTCNISFIFMISSKEKKKYKIIREYKRDKKTGSVLSGKCRISDITFDEIILADKVRDVNEKCKEIIGLSVDDFTRTVVLPQGKFSEFLKLEGKNRREMLERLFNLEKYGDKLSKKLLSKIQDVKTEKNILEGEMKGYDEFTDEKFDEVSKEYEVIENEVINLTKECDILSSHKKELDEIIKNQIELKKIQDKEEKLKSLKDDIVSKQSSLNNALSADKIISSISEFEECIDNLNKNKKDKDENQEKIKIVKENMNNINNKWQYYSERINNVIPNLKLQKSHLEEGLSEANSITALYDEINSLLKLKDNLTKQNDKLKKDLLLLEESIKALKQKEEQYHTNIDSLTVDRVIKENVQKGMFLEEKYSHYNKNLKENNSALELLIKDKSFLLISQKKNNIELKAVNDSIIDIIKRKNKLDNLEVPSEDDLFSSQKMIIILEDKLIEKEKLLLENSNLKKSLHSNTKTLNENKIELKNILASIDDLSQKFEALNIKYHASIVRKNLKENEPCPVCGSIHHLSLSASDEDINEDNLTKLNEEREKLQDKKNKLSVNISLLSTKISETNEKIKMNEDNLKTYDSNLSSEYILNQKQILNNNLKSRDNYKNECEIIEKNEKQFNTQKIILESKNDNFEKNINDLNDRVLSNEKEKISLLSKLDEITKYINLLKKDLNIDNFINKNKEILSSEDKRNSIMQEIKGLKTKIDKSLDNRDKITNEISIFDKRIENGKIYISEKKSLIDEKITNLINKIKIEITKNDLINKSADKLELNSLISYINSNIDKLNSEIISTEDNYSYYLKEKGKIEEAYQKTNDIIISLSSKIIEITNRYEILNRKINDFLNDEKISSIECVKKMLLPKDIKEIYKKQIDDYTKDCFENQGAKKRILQILDNKCIDQKEYDEFIITFNKKNNLLTQINDEKIRKFEKLKLIKTKISELKELSKKEKDICHKYAILLELDKLFKGKRFIEYIAKSRLKYISKDASYRLYKMSNGNYGLEVDDEGKFFIRDYKNGGRERDTSTLSGGETFLASLSLALALSAEIQLKGTAPLEIFFLDEGFGTLDDDLLDLVMTSLERIHSSSLNIGIISHIELIKNRVPIRLNIEEAKSGITGSTISIQYR